MKTIMCYLCEKEAPDGECTRIILGGEEYYAHDECALDAFNYYVPPVVEEEDTEDEVDAEAEKDAEDTLSDSDFLLDLAERLRHIPPAVAGTDGYHVERCEMIANDLKKTKAELARIVNNLQDTVNKLVDGED